MITEQDINEVIEQQMKNPLLRRAMGLDLPPDGDTFWEKFNELNKDRFKQHEETVNEYIKNFNAYMENME